MLDNLPGASEFSTLFSNWLDSKKTTVLLCRNVVDIMRLRIFLHEQLYPGKKTLLNVHFLTMDQWIQKILPLHSNSKNLIHGSLAEKALLLKQLENNDLPALSPLSALPGFKKEILYLWHLYSYSLQISGTHPEPDKNNPLSSELFFLFQEVHRELAAMKIITQPQLYASNQHGMNVKNVDQAICMFATDYNAVEKMKFNFIVKNILCSWKHVYIENTFVQENQPVMEPKSEVYYLKIPARFNERYTDWINTNRNFFRHPDENKHARQEFKIWMAKNIHDEYELIARSIRTLYDRGVSLHKIALLYCSSEHLPLLDYYLNMLGLTLNSPEKTPAASRPLISIAVGLIRIFSLKKNSMSVRRNTFIEFLLTPYLFFSTENKSDDTIKKLVSFLYENYAITDEINLGGLAKKLSGFQKNNSLAGIIEELIRHKSMLALNDMPSQHTGKFLHILKQYINTSVFSNIKLKSQWESLEKTILAFSDLDRYFYSGMEYSYYYSLLQDEINAIQLKIGSAEGMDNNFPEVYARNIQEGIHSPIDFLFICDITSRAFPLSDYHPDFLHEHQGHFIPLNLNSEDQKKKIRDSFKMTANGIALLFHLQNDPAPSDFVFEEIPAEPGSLLKKENILADFPVYERQHSSGQTGEAIAGLRTYPIQVYKPPQENDSLGLSFLAKYTNTGDSAVVGKFTGLAQPEENSLITSASHIENFAACPQMFWFEKACKLSPPIDYHAVRSLDKRHIGSLFHAGAKNLMDYFIQSLPGATYCQIGNNFADGRMDQLLKDSFKKAEDLIKTNYPTDYLIFTNGIISRAFELFNNYFLKFLYLAKNGKHPLHNYYPLATELCFENTAFGSFYFKGRIDRLDYLPDKELLCVMDYKTGNPSKFFCGIHELKNLSRFQMPLYVKAVHDMVEYNHTWDKKISNIQGAYEHVSDIKKLPMVTFMEINNGETVYPIEGISDTLESVARPGLEIIQEILNSGYFFAYGHKKNPDGEWEAPCSHCLYAMICDRAPYAVMLQRLQSHPLAKKFLDTLHPDSQA